MSSAFRAIRESPKLQRSVRRFKRRSGGGGRRQRGSGTSDDPIRLETPAERQARERKQRLTSLQKDLSSSGVKLTPAETKAILEGESTSTVRSRVSKRVTSESRQRSLSNLQKDLSSSGAKLTKQETRAILEGQDVGAIRSSVEQRSAGVSESRARRAATARAKALQDQGVIPVSEGFEALAQRRFSEERRAASASRVVDSLGFGGSQRVAESSLRESRLSESVFPSERGRAQKLRSQREFQRLRISSDLAGLSPRRAAGLVSSGAGAVVGATRETITGSFVERASAAANRGFQSPSQLLNPRQLSSDVAAGFEVGSFALPVTTFKPAASAARGGAGASAASRSGAGARPSSSPTRVSSRTFTIRPGEVSVVTRRVAKQPAVRVTEIAQRSSKPRVRTDQKDIILELPKATDVVNKVVPQPVLAAGRGAKARVSSLLDRVPSRSRISQAISRRLPTVSVIDDTLTVPAGNIDFAFGKRGLQVRKGAPAPDDFFTFALSKTRDTTLPRGTTNVDVTGSGISIVSGSPSKNSLSRLLPKFSRVDLPQGKAFVFGVGDKPLVSVASVTGRTSSLDVGFSGGTFRLRRVKPSQPRSNDFGLLREDISADVGGGASVSGTRLFFGRTTKPPKKPFQGQSGSVVSQTTKKGSTTKAPKLSDSDIDITLGGSGQAQKLKTPEILSAVSKTKTAPTSTVRVSPRTVAGGSLAGVGLSNVFTRKGNQFGSLDALGSFQGSRAFQGVNLDTGVFQAQTPRAGQRTGAAQAGASQLFTPAQTVGLTSAVLSSQVFKTPTSQIPRLTGGFPPRILPVPKFGFGSGSRRGDALGSVFGRDAAKFTPSVTAAAFNITQKGNKRAKFFSGFELRGL